MQILSCSGAECTQGDLKRQYLVTQNKATVALPAPCPQPDGTAFNTRFVLALEASGRVKAEPARGDHRQTPQAEQCQLPFPGRADFLPGTRAGKTNKSFSGNNLLVFTPAGGRR